MQQSVFFRLGIFVHQFKWWVIGLGFLVLMACIPFIKDLMTPFQTTGFIDETSQSAIAQEFIDKHLKINHENRFLILYQSQALTTDDANYLKKIKFSLRKLDDFPVAHDIIFPNDNSQQISKDKKSAYVVVNFHQVKPLTTEQLDQFKAIIQTPKRMSVYLGGEAVFSDGINKQTQTDLYKADMIAAPISIIVLILVFGAIVAAIVPMILGGCCALIILTVLYCLGHLFSLSIFTLNIALLLGLCLNLDYSLFIINRFRNELHKHAGDTRMAIAITLATAGRAVFFSGLAVFVSLSALLFFPINILFSIGVGGLTAAFVAVVISTLLLPAVLAVLNHKIDLLPVRRLFSNVFKESHAHVWRNIATTVTSRPVFFFLTSILILLFLASPFVKVCFGISDFRILPAYSDSRKFFDVYAEQFNENELTPIVLVVSDKTGNILSEKSIDHLYRLTSRLQKHPSVLAVNSIVTTKPRLSKSDYQMLYHNAKNMHKRFTVINVISRYDAKSEQTKALIYDLRALKLHDGFTMQLTGTPVINLDVEHTIGRIFPYVIAWIAILTYVILFILLRSVFLPLKAIFMNILSLTASYGVMVFIFQQGHFHQLLDFAPQGMLDISLLIIVFCAIFGFSMDYEVFLLTRIHESYLQTHDNKLSIIFGIEQSSRIITSAALIVICICGSFMVADVLMVKQFGLGIAVAIFVDAFIIRSILVPSTMVLLKDWNWYMFKWMKRFFPE